MDKLGTVSGLRGAITSQIPQEQNSSKPAQQKVLDQEATSTSTKSSQQEATTHRNESSFQAKMLKEGLLKETGNEKVDGKTTEGTRFVERTLKSESEIRKIVQENAFPAVKQGMEKGSFSLNDTNCHVAAGLMKAALEKQGLRNVTIREAPLHAYVEVQTKEGKTLIIDPTASQFFKDGTSIDHKLQNEGFVGTKQELRQLIDRNLEHWKFPESWPVDQNALDSARNKGVPGMSQEEGIAVISGHTQAAEGTYFNKGVGTVGVTAEKIAERCKNNDLNRPFKLTSEKDIGPNLNQAWEIIKEQLEK